VQDYDERGEYVKAWLPELVKVPAHKVHAPWTMTDAEMETAGVLIGKDYPHPPKSTNDRSDEGKAHICLPPQRGCAVYMTLRSRHQTV
jgi:deoxyribodipyrimidine photolyase